MPKTLASTAEVKATVAEVCKASVTKVLDSALPYHSVENPCICTADRPALKLNSAMIAMGA